MSVRIEAHTVEPHSFEYRSDTPPHSLCSGLCTSSKLSLIEDSTFLYLAAYSATSQHSPAMLSPRLMFFWLFVAFHVANALNAAAPYESVYFYNAYKIEYAATIGNPALRTISPECVHKPSPARPGTPGGIIEQNFIQSTIDAGVSGICSFDDFLGGIQDKGWKAYKSPKPDPSNPTSLTITLNPDADAFAAQALNPTTLGCNRLGFRTENLLSAAVRATYVKHNPAGGEVYPYAGTISKISDAVQTAREAVANGKVVQEVFNVWVTYSVLLLDRVTHFRIGDNSRFFVATIQADSSWTSSPMQDHNVINDEPYKNIGGDNVDVTRWDRTNRNYVVFKNYQVIDYEASFNAAADAGTPLTSEQKHSLLAFDANYGTGGGDATGGNQAKIHRDVIESAKFSRVLHQTPITIETPEEDGATCSCCVVM
ncbi:hypothetical protein B7463_g8176, partial [Scytalidium lignicola]